VYSPLYAGAIRDPESEARSGRSALAHYGERDGHVGDVFVTCRSSMPAFRSKAEGRGRRARGLLLAVALVIWTVASARCSFGRSARRVQPAFARRRSARGGSRPIPRDGSSARGIDGANGAGKRKRRGRETSDVD